MAQTAPAQRSPVDVPKRPRGILKNSNSYQYSSPDARISPTSEHAPSFGNHESPAPATSGGRPPMPRELSEKEIVQMNTELNAGNGHRRSSSNPQGSISRRQSSQSHATNGQQDEHGMRLKWDEANLYLNEGQMGGKMKIDEPKTPYAKHYDPAEDEEEVSNINANELAVDELDMEKSKTKKPKDNDIPGLDIGEPELEPDTRRESDGERRVVVDQDSMDVDGGHHGEENEADMTREERDKHRKFEAMRKKHYEMKNIKNLLGHSEDLEGLDDEAK